MTKNITPRNDKNQRHGYWEWYQYDYTLWYKCYYVNGKLVGYNEYYHNFTETKVELRFYV